MIKILGKIDADEDLREVLNGFDEPLKECGIRL
jgi:hypothetical protein